MDICIFFCTFADQMENIIQYIKSFLLYGNEAFANLIGYTADEAEWDQYPVVVVPNGHLEKDIVLPSLEDIVVEARGEKKWVIRTDIIYNTFFFISRAEELINTERDEHGRFLAKYSILGKKNRLMIPTVDEYSRLLMKLLALPVPTPSFSKIYLTHDVDSVEQYHHWRGAIGGLVRGHWRKVLRALRDVHNDPAFTFSWLIKQDKKVDGAEVIYFVKDTTGKGHDYPQYPLDGTDFTTAKQLIEHSEAKLGWHSSYYGADASNGGDFDRSLHRSHYLRCNIDRMQELVDKGVTDDFTMMFADQIGFRLQTTRCVRWINPKTMELTNLTLHPMTVMDCTLSHSQYMGLNEDEAYFECQRLFEKVHQNAGELVLLWHNTIVTKEGYHRSLYPKLLNLLV